MTFLQFSDKSVPYGVFVKDVAAEASTFSRKMKPTPNTLANGKPMRYSDVGTWSGGAGRARSAPASVRANWNTARQTCDCYKELNRTI